MNIDSAKYVQVTDDLRKFLQSAYGEKILNTAKLHGQEEFVFAKKRYSIQALLRICEGYRMDCNKKSN